MPTLPSSPLHQQPTRALSDPSNPAVPLTPIHSTHCFPRPYRPRTQIEALPPGGILQDFNFNQSQCPGMPRPFTSAPVSPPPQQYDSATRHPVFFTRTLQKPPFGVGAGNSVSPVAMGYVENSVLQKRDGGNVKL
jgi:hypothetical protein